MKMKPVTIIKILIDVAMLILFLLLMSYHLISDSIHEWIGLSSFILFIAHNILNWRWYKHLFKGKYSPFRIFQTIINISLVVFVIGCIVSSLLISGHVFSFLNFSSFRFGRSLHLCATIWTFILACIHFGTNFQMFINITKNIIKLKENVANIIKWVLRVTVIAICIFGVYIFISRKMWEEMFLLTEFKWFDYQKDVFTYIFENIMLLALFTTIGYYLKKLLLKIKKRRKTLNKTLVAYFSCTGTTARVAKHLATTIGADLYEIKPSEPYTSQDLDWNNKNSRSSMEMSNQDYRPLIKAKITNMKDYDTIFVGFPIWWYVAPTIINTFIESYDFSLKTIVPFATSGGSKMGKTVEVLQKLSSPSTKWVEGRVLSSSVSSEEITSWVDSLKIK